MSNYSHEYYLENRETIISKVLERYHANIDEMHEKRKVSVGTHCAERKKRARPSTERAASVGFTSDACGGIDENVFLFICGAATKAQRFESARR